MREAISSAISLGRYLQMTTPYVMSGFNHMLTELLGWTVFCAAVLVMGVAAGALIISAFRKWREK